MTNSLDTLIARSKAESEIAKDCFEFICELLEARMECPNDDPQRGVYTRLINRARQRQDDAIAKLIATGKEIEATSNAATLVATRVLSTKDVASIAIATWRAANHPDGCIYPGSKLRVKKIHLGYTDCVTYEDGIEGIGWKATLAEFIEIVARRHW